MEIKLEKQPLKTAIVCLGNRISLTAKNVRSVDLEYLREYIFTAERVGFSHALASQSYEITYRADNDTFVIRTKGIGHGVGMSQYGANVLAQNGKNYTEILQHYYDGVVIR